MDGDGVASTQPVAGNDQPAMPFPEAQPTSSVAAVSIRLPLIWLDDLQLWFTPSEAQFDTPNITTELARFNYIVGSVSPEYATVVRNILRQPPTNASYTTLNATLIKRMTPSEYHRFQQLLTA